jgi:hypothetical protein
VPPSAKTALAAVDEDEMGIPLGGPDDGDDEDDEELEED